MGSFTKVVLPTDFHHDDLHTVQYAMGVTRPGAKLYILHVGDQNEATPLGNTAAEEMETLKTHAVGMGFEVEILFREGDLAEEVTKVERDVGADLVCVSASRHTGVDRLIIPTHYSKIVRSSPLPVLVVMPPPKTVLESKDVTKVNRIMCPQDETDFSRTALPLAAELSRQYDAELLVLHVAPPLKPDDREGHAHRDETKSALTIAVNDYPDVRAKVEIVENKNPVWAIVDTANDHDVDLVVLPTHGRSPISQIWEASTAESVAPRLSCPMITIRPDLMNA